MSIGDRRSWTEPSEVERAADELRTYGREVDGPGDLGDLVDRLAGAEVVLLGEATHGTSEFYRWRAALTAALLSRGGFEFVAVEGDWTSCFAVDRFVKHRPGGPGTAREAVDAFDRWPTWMWANWECVEFLEWLAERNAGRPDDEAVGFFGLDVYGLHESIAAVVEYLEDVDPAAADRAREAYRCFEPYGEDGQAYARSIRMVPEDCEDEVVSVLSEVRGRRWRDADSDGSTPDPDPEDQTPEARFAAEQNALVATNAESYYRALATGENSWNVRDRHMTDTLQRLREFHDGGAIVWAHNTHVGDARATDMPRRDRLNLGQLLREGDAETAIVGFGTHRGSVVAADEWGATPRELRVPEAQAGSYEDVFHAAGGDRLLFTDRIGDGDSLAEPRGNRAIGVVYRPALESGNYVPTDLRARYDAFVHVDETVAVHALDRHQGRDRVPELYPHGL